jgi:hypothetical protein
MDGMSANEPINGGRDEIEDITLVGEDDPFRVELEALREFYSTWLKMHEAMLEFKLAERQGSPVRDRLKVKERAARHSQQLVDLSREIKNLRQQYLGATEQ